MTKQHPKLPAKTALSLVKTKRVQAAVERNLEEWARNAKGAFASNTERAAQSDTRIWLDWCKRTGNVFVPATPEAVRDFVDGMAEKRKPATVRRYLSSIAALHRAAGVVDPTKAEPVRLSMRRMNKAQGVRQEQSRGLGWGQVRQMLDAAHKSLRGPDNPTRGARDRALVLVAYDTGARRSELAALRVESLTVDSDDGSGTVLIERGKTDQEGHGAIRYLSPETVRAVRAWLEISGITEGTLFLSVPKVGSDPKPLSGDAIYRIIRAMARRAGIDLDGIGGHSLRVGMAQDMVAAGIDVGAIMQAAGWKTPRMVARYSERLSDRAHVDSGRNHVLGHPDT